MYIYGDDWGSTSCLVFQVTPPPFVDRRKRWTGAWTDSQKNQSEKKWHLDGIVFEIVNPAYSVVDIRHFWVPEGQTEVMATRRGLALKRYGGGQIKTSLELVEEAVQDLESTQPSSETHQNQMGMLICPECSPCTYKKWTSQETCANRCISVVFYRTFIFIKFTRWWL